MSLLGELTPEALNAWSGEVFQLVDVRGHEELARGIISGMIHIPMHQIPTFADRLDARCPVVLYCAHGVRSAQVGRYLLQQGFPKVYHLVGGIEAWAQRYPVAPVEAI